MNLQERHQHESTAAQQWTPERIASTSQRVLVLVVIGVLLGLFAIAASLYYVAVVIGAGLLLILISWQFEAALVLYALAAFVIWGRTPDMAVGGSGMGKGIYVSQVMLGVLLTLWVGKYLLGQLPKGRIRSGFHVPLALYLAYSVLNVVNSFIFWDPHVNKLYQYPSVNMIELGLRFLSAGAFIIYATSISSRNWLRWALVAALAPGIYNLLNALSGWVAPVVAPWWPLVIFLPACYCFAVALEPECKPCLRVLAFLFVAASVFVILVQNIGWVSGWLGLSCGLFTIALVKNRRVFAVALVASLIAVAVAWPYLHKNVVVASEKEGDFDRFSLMQGAWRYATTFPLGVGLGNYRSYNSFYYGWKWGTTSYTSAHGTYAQHLSEMGIPGFALLVLVLGSGFFWTLKSFRVARDPTVRVLLLTVLGQMTAIAAAGTIGDYILPTYHNGGLGNFSATVYSWVFWGLAVSSVRLSQVDSEADMEDTALERG